MSTLFFVLLMIYIIATIAGTRLTRNNHNKGDLLFISVYKSGYYTFLILLALLFLYDLFHPLTALQFKNHLMLIITVVVLSGNVAIFFSKNVKSNSR